MSLRLPHSLAPLLTPISLSLKKPIGNWQRNRFQVCACWPQWIILIGWQIATCCSISPHRGQSFFKKKKVVSTNVSLQCTSLTAPFSVFQTIMHGQQLLLLVILYDWFSHTIWLVNNCAEDIKRTPAPSHQHHCQWASAWTEEKKKGEKRKKKIPLLHRWLEVSLVLRQTCLSEDKELHILTTAIKNCFLIRQFYCYAHVIKTALHSARKYCW